MTALLPYFLAEQAKAVAEAENAIICALVIDALIAGNSISIHNGLSDLSCSRSPKAIMEAIQRDRDHDIKTPRLLIHSEKGAQIGWIQLEIGSQGWNVMSDHCKRIEPLMADAQALADEYAKKFLMET